MMSASTVSSEAILIDVDEMTKNRTIRTIKNGLVAVDDVQCEPGDEYSNWIALAKIKLMVSAYVHQQINRSMREDIVLFSYTFLMYIATGEADNITKS